MIGSPSPPLGLWDLAAGRFIRGWGEQFFGVDFYGFFAIPIADTVVLSCVPKVFMQTAEIPDVSLPIGRGATQHFGSSCSFFFTDLLCVATVHVLPSYFKILYGFLEIGLCMQVSGVKHWSAEILWNSLM